MQSLEDSYPSDSEDMLTENTALITEEKAMSGSIKLSVILTYCRASTWSLTVVTLILYSLGQAASIATNFWLSKWSNAQACQQESGMNQSTQVTSCSGSDQ